MARIPTVPESLLLGRERELGAFDDLFDAVRERGSALLLRAEAGMGKSALLEAAKALARARGMSILTANGLESETNLPYAGLHELLFPILDRLDRLAGPQQLALRAAFGLAEAPAADLFLIGLGALDLLGEFADERPLLVTIDDAQWLDPSSMKILLFVARRLQSEPIVLLIASRDSPEMPTTAIIPELRIEGLDDRDALRLLQTHSPKLSAAIRDRVLHVSVGNPLALLELPAAIASDPSVLATLPEHLPLTKRLERAFASRISELPAATRQLLLLAAVNDGSNLVEVMTAAVAMSEGSASLDALTPAISTGLLRVDNANVLFRHPLVRSAIHHTSSISERVAAHAVLATVLKNDPDRSTWHQAAATLGLDDAVAERLESAAMRAQQRGDVRAAIQAFERAAQLSADNGKRSKYLLQAAELAFEIGWPDVVVGLLRQAESQGLAPRDRVKLSCYREAVQRTMSGAQALINIVDNVKNADDVDLALDLLSGPSTIGWWAEPDQEQCEHIISALGAARNSSEDDPRFLLILAMTSAIDRGAYVIESLHRLISPFGRDGRIARVLGLVGTQVGDFEVAARFLDIAATVLRSEGRLTLLANALVLRSLSAYYLGNRDVAITSADEGERLAIETAQPIYASAACAVSAMMAAMRGDNDAAENLAAEAEHRTEGLGTLLAEVQMARGLNALAAGRFEDAFHQYSRMFDPSDHAYHPMKECFWIGDLAEAALFSGHGETARAKLLEMEEVARRTPSPQFHQSLHYARAMLADHEEAEQIFERTLAAVSAPFIRARLQLAFGRWLRRAKRGKEAHVVLQAALESFDRLYAYPWSERAHKELRALGVIVERRGPERREELTPQELQIALMASEGLSNREIAEKLYLSHRTVGSHLYRIFPKLDITSRHQLPSVLPSKRAVAT